MKRIISDEKKENIKKNLIIALLILACLALFYYLFHNVVHNVYNAIMSVFIPALIGLFISYLCEPVYDFFTNKLKLKKALSVGIVTVLLLTIIGLLFYFVGSFIVVQIGLFIKNDWPKMYESINTWLINHEFQKLDDMFSGITSNIGSAIIESGGAANIIMVIRMIFSSITGFLVDVALVIIFFIYFLYGKGTIFKGIVSLFPKRIRTHLITIGTRSNDVIHSFVKGKFISIIFLITLFAIAFSIIGLGPMGIVFAIILGCLDIVPIVGPLIGTLFPMLYTFIFKEQFALGIWTPVAILGIDLIAQVLQEKVISPLVIGKSMDINSLLLLSAMVFFGTLSGVLGIVLAIPICGVIKVIYNYLKETMFVDEESDLNKNLTERISRKIHKEDIDIDEEINSITEDDEQKKNIDIE